MNTGRYVFVAIILAVLVPVTLPAVGVTSSLTKEPTEMRSLGEKVDGPMAGFSEYRNPATAFVGNVSWTGMTNPSGYHCNLAQISTPYGSGCHIDSAGNNSVPAYGGYDFFAYSNSTYRVGGDGSIEVQGYFRQNDTFDSYTMPGRREVRIFVMYANNTGTVVKQLPVISYIYGTNWLRRNIIITGLIPGELVQIGVGRHNGWATDWRLTAEWTGITVTGNASWTVKTIPNGNFYNFYSIPTPYGPGHHIDTAGRSGNPDNYAFFGSTIAEFPVGNDGSIQVRGYFRQNDTFDQTIGVGRRDLRIFLMYSDDPSTIVYQQLILVYADGTNWLYRNVTISGLAAGKFVNIGFGRYDQWSIDYQLAAEWARIDFAHPTYGYFGGGGGGGTGGGTGGGAGGGGSNGFSSSLVAAIVPVLGLVLFIAAVFVVRRRSSEDHARDDLTRLRTEVGQTRPDETAVQEQPLPISSPIPCPECGALVKDTNAAYCFKCGASLGEDSQRIAAQEAENERRVPLGTCMVCRLRIREGEETLRCPYCGNVAHKDHILEWLHVKSFCPICGSHLSEEYLRH